MDLKDNEGILFKNALKKNDNAPDLTGKAVVEGVQKDIAVWEKEGKRGKYFRVIFKDPYVKIQSS